MSVINPVKPSIAASPSSEDRAVDERTVRTIQQQYQVSHQEEFLRLRAQVEALLADLQTRTLNASDSDRELAL
ncbi:hypothetical protein [Altericista sp. CCNU0014]|uniref:hypothetical protein n=1 Tax=Altericista sp. CCNU0014 TaxID=3082949 RepID=UPI00384AD128